MGISRGYRVFLQLVAQTSVCSGSWTHVVRDSRSCCRVSCVNSWGSSLPRDNFLACMCKNSVHSHLNVCEDSLDGVSQLKFSLKRRFSRTRYAFVPHFWQCTDAQRDSLYGGQFRNSHHIFVAEMTDGLGLISRGETSVVCALICNA